MSTKSVIIGVSKGIIQNKEDIKNHIDTSLLKNGIVCDFIKDKNLWTTTTNILLPKDFPFTIMFIIDGTVYLDILDKYHNERNKTLNYKNNNMSFNIYRSNDDKYYISYVDLM